MTTYPIIDDDELDYEGELEIGMDVIDYEDPADNLEVPNFDF